MRVHLVTTEFPPFPGGVGTWAGAVASGLAGLGHEVHVWARQGQPIPSVVFHRLWGRSWNRWGPVWTAAQVRPALQPDDVVLCTTWPLALHLGRPLQLLVAWHGSDLTRPAVLPGREAVAARATNLAVSRFLAARLGAPARVLCAPVDPAPLARRGDALLTVARLVPSKGVDRVLRFGARLGRRVVVVGDGPERPRLEALAAELGVRATFLGATRDIPWDGTWALALFSRPWPDGSGAEGLGLVLLEAAARGIPTLGSNVGGIPEVADVVLDPEVDVPGALPEADAVRARVEREHGVARCAREIEAVLARPPGADLR